MKAKIVSLGEYVVIAMTQPKTETPSGIILTEGSMPPCEARGFVVSVGRGTFSSSGVLIPLELKVGDDVFYDAHAQEVFEVDGVDYIRIKEKYVWTKIEPVKDKKKLIVD
jgi:co-chaperonin GroES (HSP10)